MAPRRQYCLMVTRPRKTRDGAIRTLFYWGERLGEMVKQRVKMGDKFSYTKYTRGPIFAGLRTSPETYGTET